MSNKYKYEKLDQNNNDDKDNRIELIGGTTSSFNWQAASGVPQNDLNQMYKEEVKKQDSKLSLISESIGRQKEYAIAINVETKEHIDILERMDKKIHKTSDLVSRGLSFPSFIINLIYYYFFLFLSFCYRKFILIFALKLFEINLYVEKYKNEIGTYNSLILNIA